MKTRHRLILTTLYTKGQLGANQRIICYSFGGHIRVYDEWWQIDFAILVLPQKLWITNTVLRCYQRYGINYQATDVFIIAQIVYGILSPSLITISRVRQVLQVFKNILKRGTTTN